MSLTRHNNNKPYSKLNEKEKVECATSLYQYLMETRLRHGEDKGEQRTMTNRLQWMKKKLDGQGAVIITKQSLVLNRLWTLEIEGNYTIRIISDKFNEDFMTILEIATQTRRVKNESSRTGNDPL